MRITISNVMGEKKEVKSSIDEIKDILVESPMRYFGNQYTAVECGGHNLTIGEMIEKVKGTKLFYGKPTYIHIVDKSNNKIYNINFKEA